MEGTADEGSGEVGAAAAECGGDAGFVGADEAAQDGDAAGVDVGADATVAAVFDERVLGDGFLVGRVGEDDVAGVDVDGVEAALAEGVGDDDAGEAFAIADDEVGDARGEFEDGGEAAQDFVESVEFLFDVGSPVGPFGDGAGQDGRLVVDCVFLQ